MLARQYLSLCSKYFLLIIHLLGHRKKQLVAINYILKEKEKPGFATISITYSHCSLNVLRMCRW